MNEKICKNCEHYVKHYVRLYKEDGRFRYSFVNCGHCVYPRIKKREPTHKACEHFKCREGKN
jgi:hypothetical protein